MTVVMAPDLIDPFHKAIHAKLMEERSNRIIGLAAGSAAKITEDTQTVAEKYAAQVSYIKALEDVMEICKQLERERYGERPGREEE